MHHTLVESLIKSTPLRNWGILCKIACNFIGPLLIFALLNIVDGLTLYIWSLSLLQKTRSGEFINLTLIPHLGDNYPPKLLNLITYHVGS